MDSDQNSQLILYQTEDGETQIQVVMQGETVWLTQKEMAELFQRDQSVISRHINNVFKEGELDAESTMQFLHIAHSDKPVAYYNLDVIISVGCRVKSHPGTQFRIWATRTLREYLVKGYVMDDARLEGSERNYFDELVERVRRIRSSEKQFYRKVLEIFATSIDYDTKTAQAHEFFATVQNKFYYAIHGRTAAELIAERINSQSPTMGLTNWSGQVVTAKDAHIAKNYLQEIELKRLNLLVEQFLAYAELQAVEKRAMYMQQWVNKLDEFLRFNEKEVLQHQGKVPWQDMETKAREELQRYHEQQQKLEAGNG